MPKDFKTPGVYIQEKNAFPNSIVAVATAVPVFISYTERAERNGKSLVGVPTRITSLAEYIEQFGGSFRAKFSLAEADPSNRQDAFDVNGRSMVVKIRDHQTFYLYSSIRLFYGNGGGACYIVSVDTYGEREDGLAIQLDDFVGSSTKADPFERLKREAEPTLVLVPDAVALGEECYSRIYTKILSHCASMQTCFGIFDIAKPQPTECTADVVGLFREQIGRSDLEYGAAYYPWLRASVVQPGEVTFENLDNSVALDRLLPVGEAAAVSLVRKFNELASPTVGDRQRYHQDLTAASLTYRHIIEGIRNALNELPPSGAIAGVYAANDSSRGVWKAPANVYLSMVKELAVAISSEQQECLAVDVLAGKSINVIRAFPGTGILVWGARTLDGNSQDWRYINVRRTMTMVEQSLKMAARAYIFEPNTANTWVVAKGAMVSFLTNLWKQGALAGSYPEQAFKVMVGLGETMTPEDILDGQLRIVVLVSILRPEEFISIEFQQQMQPS